MEMSKLRKNGRAAAMATAAIVIAAGSAYGQAAKTLNACQKTAGKETLKYVQSYVKAVGGCADKISKAVIEGQPAGAATDVASQCAKAFSKIENTILPEKTLGGKLAAKIGKSCDPDAVNTKALHTEPDVLGTGATLGESLLAENLGNWCSNFGGDGAIGDIDEWVSCLTAAGTCAARQDLATAYPRILEWLNAVKPGILALDPTCSGTCASCSDQTVVDACNALEATEAAIDGGSNDDRPDIKCGPGVVPGTDAVVLVTGETTSHGAGSDGDVQAGAPFSYTVNPDGTITDNNTGLMWEKKDYAGGVHHLGNDYSWCADDNPQDSSCDTAGNPMDGTITSVFLDTLNNKCDDDESTSCTTDADCVGAPDTYASNDLCGHAGHRDWRVPNRRELDTLIDLTGSGGYLVQAEFNSACVGGCTVLTCSCTRFAGYWTSSSTSPGSVAAFWVNFAGGGEIGGSAKFVANRPVRAVRGGL